MKTGAFLYNENNATVAWFPFDKKPPGSIGGQ